MQRFIQYFLRQARGVAMIEFALVAPFLLLMLFGGVELSRYMLIAQKIDKAAYALADITNQFPPATRNRATGEINETQMRTNVFPQFARLMAPFDVQQSGAAIISSIRKESNIIRINWQVAGGGSYSDGMTTSVVNARSPSAIGPAVRNQPANFVGPIAADMAGMREGEFMVISEVFFRYRPLLSKVLQGLKMPLVVGESTLVRRVYTRARIGDLLCLPDNFIYPPCENAASPPPPPGGGGGSQCPPGQCLDSDLGSRDSGIVGCGECIRNGGFYQATNGRASCARFQCNNGIWETRAVLSGTCASVCQ